MVRSHGDGCLFKINEGYFVFSNKSLLELGRRKLFLVTEY